VFDDRRAQMYHLEISSAEGRHPYGPQRYDWMYAIMMLTENGFSYSRDPRTWSGCLKFFQTSSWKLTCEPGLESG
jgi:hypothetical protein